MPYKIRLATSDDVSFIFNSWLKSFRDTGYLARAISNIIYFENHHKLLEKVLQRATCYIACDSRYPDQIAGYVVAENIDNVFVLHYIYVKHNFRKTGIARELFNSFNHDLSATSCCTHLTKAGERLIAKYNMIYHPYIILNDYEVKKL